MKPVTTTLWWIAIAPALWAAHFLACYVSAAIWCEKFASGGEKVWLNTAITAFSVIALTGIAWVAWSSLRNFRRGNPTLPYDFDDPEERTHFLGFTAFLLAILSGIATLFTVLVFLLVGSCD